VCKNILKKEIQGELFNLIYFSSDKPKKIISIPKKLGKAIVRNKIKRKIRESFKNQKTFNFQLKVIVKKNIKSAKFSEINKELQLLTSKIDI